MNKFNQFLVILTLLITSCSETTNRLDSDDYSSAKERVDILKNEIHSFSNIHDAEFELFNVNGFKTSGGTSMPGASSSDYKFVIKVDTADIKKWREGMIKLDPEHDDYNWTKEIVKNRAEGWRTTSQPTYYVRQDLPDGWSTTLVEYYPEGILFKRVMAN